MRTARSPTVHASVDSHEMSARLGDHQVNKFAQVSGIGHQMSLAGESLCRERAWFRGPGLGGSSMARSKVLFVMVTWGPPCEQTRQT